jgi:hypothetical protein
MDAAGAGTCLPHAVVVQSPTAPAASGDPKDGPEALWQAFPLDPKHLETVSQREPQPERCPAAGPKPPACSRRQISSGRARRACPFRSSPAESSWLSSSSSSQPAHPWQDVGPSRDGPEARAPSANLALHRLRGRAGRLAAGRRLHQRRWGACLAGSRPSRRVGTRACSSAGRPDHESPVGSQARPRGPPSRRASPEESASPARIGRSRGT